MENGAEDGPYFFKEIFTFGRVGSNEEKCQRKKNPWKHLVPNFADWRLRRIVLSWAPKKTSFWSCDRQLIASSTRPNSPRVRMTYFCRYKALSYLIEQCCIYFRVTPLSLTEKFHDQILCYKFTTKIREKWKVFARVSLTRCNGQYY